jgi:hypothetical protein
MSMPQFPDPLNRRELVNPGATAHKAGLSLEDRVKALEQGALGRPGPGVVAGSVPVADTAATGNTRWENHNRVSTLPSSPVDGQIAHYQTSSMATDGIMWIFQYRSGGGSYKWEFIGGSRWSKEVTTQETTTSGSYANLATVGPTVTAPLAGEYSVLFGLDMYDFTSPNTATASYSIGAAAATDADSIRISPNTGDSAGSFYTNRDRIKTLAASDALTMKYKVSGGTGNFLNRMIGIIPIRVG